MELTKTAIRAGVWEGVLTAEGPAPAIEVWHLETALEGVQVQPDETTQGQFRVTVPIPAQLLFDGVQTFVVTAGDGTHLDSFAIVAGAPLDHDLRAEIDLLRAELDLLKKAFRRHFPGGGPGR